jgi:HD-GYP domain-containing protein (c-di-GMP phosphodiesterase class II)
MNLSQTHSFFPRELVKEGVHLSVNLYVFLPHNQTLILYRKRGEKINSESLKSLKKIPHGQLLYSKNETSALYEMSGEAISIEIRDGDVSAPAVKAMAAGVLETFHNDANLSDCMNRASVLVQTLIRDFGNSVSIGAYDAAIERAKNYSTDLLTTHNQQVSVLSVLMALAIGDFPMVDIADLAAAGLMHDLGLSEITHALAQGHFIEIREMTTQEKVIYMRHSDLTIEQIKKQKIVITPGIERIIQHHHECWDGTGFKSLVATKIYRPARVLKLADDLVSTIQGSNYKLGFKAALAKLGKNSNWYDPAMLAGLSGKN